ncbi:sensor histidine kinase [Krasilnikoviella flava]|uniref:sensor histidine kinase n=1 Tax=Krasilnikoviella flava TaxID=526729 RepID=UPI001C37BC54|nr:histidine kinase [Krasilnikoviella flava]
MPAAPARPSRARRVWGETWRVLVALLAGMTALVFVAWESDTGQRTMSDGLLALDLLVGLAALPVLLLRRRAPLTVALVLTAASAVSVLAIGAQAIAIISLATRRRWWQLAAVGVAFAAASWVYERTHPTTSQQDVDTWVGGLGSVLIFALLVWIGAYIGLRREHLASLRERAETAEREQASRVAQARTAERTRIAREMHDVLAHRISLVAMHAGALAYRTDLPPEKVAETAAVVQENAHAALAELREVLGVLRDPAPASPEPPQPTLADLDELLAEARASGVDVRLADHVDRVDELGEAVSRHAYRIVQEGMTNARKHAPWAPVSVALAGAPGDGLTITVRNPVRTVGPDPELPTAPESGLGLVGLTERAELVGGRLSYGTTGDTTGGVAPRDGRAADFLLEAWLPWAA